VIKLKIALCVFVVLWTGGSIAQPGSLDDIYTKRAVVAGKDERNRPLGFTVSIGCRVSGLLIAPSGRPSSAIANSSRM
jgi:hypothetical protein